jgi:hypothetical protein
MGFSSVSHRPDSILYSFPTGGMSVGGTKSPAPPIFLLLVQHSQP